MSRGPALSRRAFLAAVGALAIPAAHAQAPERRLGILAMGERGVETANWADMLRQLAALGYRESANLTIAWRFAEDAPARLPGLARELAATRAHAIATMGTLPTRALQRATSTIAIVTGAVADPVLGGFARSLSRPGGNVTGLSLGGTEIADLQIGLLRNMVPTLGKLAIVRGSGEWNEEEIVGPMASAAKSAGIEAVSVVVTGPTSLEAAFRELRGGRSAGAAFVHYVDGMTPAHVAQMALRYKVPTMFAERQWVAAGGLMAYNMYHDDPMKRIAQIVFGLFRGGKASETPFELPANSYFVVNTRTAAALGLSVPPQVLIGAHERIE